MKIMFNMIYNLWLLINIIEFVQIYIIIYMTNIYFFKIKLNNKDVFQNINNIIQDFYKNKKIKK